MTSRKPKPGVLSGDDRETELSSYLVEVEAPCGPNYARHTHDRGIALTDR